MFYHFCQVEAFNFVRCDKISNFCSIRRTFFKKALAFSSEKCYLVSNKSGSRIQRLRRALHLPALGFILLIIMLFSSFTFLSFTLSRKGRKKRLPNLHGEALFSVFRFLFKDRPYSIQPLSLAAARQSSTLCRLRDISLRPEGVFPSRGASGETGNSAGTAKASPTRGGGNAKH